MRYEDVIGQFAGRQVGSPTTPASPGAPPGVSQPGQPSTPGQNSAMPGRKPDNPMPMFGQGGSPWPIPQQADVKPPEGREATQRQANNLNEQKNVNQAQPVMMLNRLPSRSEFVGFPPGVTVRTPYGDLDHEGNLAMSAEFEQKQKEAMVRARQKFGPHPWAGMAGAPEMEMKLGASYFNPFTGKFGRAE